MPRALAWIVGGLFTGLVLLLALQLLRRQPGDVTHAVSASPSGIPQGHVYSGVVEEPDNLNPFTTEGSAAWRYVLRFTHDTLLDTDPQDGTLRPCLAERFAVAPDGLSFTVDLRPDVVFADGEPLRREDVLFTWEVSRSPDIVLGFCGVGLSLVRDVELVGERTLRIHLKQAHFEATRIVGESWIVAQRRFFLDRVAALAAAQRVEPVPPVGSKAFGSLLAQIRGDSGPGTGPYRIGTDSEGRSTWRKGQELRLLRHEGSWWRRERPGTWNFAGVRLRFLHEPAAVTSAVLAREIDWYSQPDAEQLLAAQPGLQRDYRLVAYDSRNLGVFWVRWNCARPELSRPDVRRALGMLFDRTTIQQRYLPGHGPLAVALAKRSAPEYPHDLQPLPYDPPAARRLLRDAGFDPEAGRPLRFSLCVPAAGAAPWFRQIGEQVVDAAQKAGVQVQLQLLDAVGMQRALQGTDWGGVLQMVNFRTWVDPYDWLHSAGAFHETGCFDAEVDDLLAHARTELDAERRAGLLARAHRRVYELQPVSFLAHPLAVMLFNRHIQEATPGPIGLWPERFWVPVEFQRR